MWQYLRPASEVNDLPPERGGGSRHAMGEIIYIKSYGLKYLHYFLFLYAQITRKWCQKAAPGAIRSHAQRDEGQEERTCIQRLRPHLLVLHQQDGAWSGGDGMEGWNAIWFSLI